VILDPTLAAAALAREAGLVRVRVGEEQAWTLDGGEAVRIVGIGWATVDLERAAADLELAGADIASPGAMFEPGVGDDLLAAASLVGRPVGQPVVILLEPISEDRLAAGLARRGEGPLALYVAPVHGSLGTSLDRLAAAGIRTRTGQGPVGEAALVLGRPAAGPQLILVAVPSEP
jgi:hypothetical protein